MEAVKKFINDIVCKIKGAIPKGAIPKLPMGKIPFMKGAAGKGVGGPGKVVVDEGSRKMRFPYTHSAKVAQFPWLFYIKNNWIWRYYLIAVVLCIPIFAKISEAANSPANKQNWADQLAKDAAAEHH